jgi:protease-4
MTIDAPAPQPTPPPPPVPDTRRFVRRQGSWAVWILLALLIGSAFVNLVFLAALLFGISAGPVHREALVDGSAAAREKILLVPVRGLLIEGAGGLWSEGDAVGTTLQALDQAERDEDVRAVLLSIDSPGGGISDCDRIHHRLAGFRKARPGVPVLAAMGDMATSGGYYIAAPADWIVAQRSTVTGSIGVIMQMVNVERLAEMAGVRMETVKSAAHKDAGSPFRSLTPEERKRFQEMIDTMYEQFLQVVLDGRKATGLTREELLPLADGRVMTADKALQAKLVDAIGFLDDAWAEARRRAKAPGAKVVRYERPPGLLDLFRAGSPAPDPAAAVFGRLLHRVADGSGRMMYLWAPGF